jgi:predicted solute-binding protein
MRKASGLSPRSLTTSAIIIISLFFLSIWNIFASFLCSQPYATLNLDLQQMRNMERIRPSVSKVASRVSRRCKGKLSFTLQYLE